MNNKLKNFSLISYLSGEEYKKVRRLQKNLYEITGSKKCLEDWLPHITIGDGVVLSVDDMKEIETELGEFVQGQNTVQVNIKGYGGTSNWKGAVENKITPYVIWLDVKISPELVQLFNNLRDKITSQYSVWLPRTVDYAPHITLAFADLSEEGYKKGMAYLSSKTFEFSFLISHIALVESYGEGSMTSVERKKFYFTVPK